MDVVISVMEQVVQGQAGVNFSQRGGCIIVNIIWRDKKWAYQVSTFTVGNKYSVIVQGKPDGSLGSGRNWYWMGGVKGRTLSGAFR